MLKGKTIIDIGCGKGGFLRRLCAMSGASGIGFDKSFAMTRCETIPGVRFVNDWFQNTYTDVQPDFVSCRHVIEHIAEPVPFLRALRAHPAIRPETVFYFEVPNALYTLRDLGIWDLIYAHVSRFARAGCGFAGVPRLSAIGSSMAFRFRFGRRLRLRDSMCSTRALRSATNTST